MHALILRMEEPLEEKVVEFGLPVIFGCRVTS